MHTIYLRGTARSGIASRQSWGLQVHYQLVDKTVGGQYAPASKEAAAIMHNRMVRPRLGSHQDFHSAPSVCGLDPAGIIALPCGKPVEPTVRAVSTQLLVRAIDWYHWRIAPASEPDPLQSLLLLWSGRQCILV